MTDALIATTVCSDPAVLPGTVVNKYDATALMHRNMHNQDNTVLRLCVDLDFDDVLLNNRERNSVCKQLSLTYGSIRAAMQPVVLHLVALRGQVLATMRTQGIDKWAAHLHEENLSGVFCADEIVYLSPDSSEILDTIDSKKVRFIHQRGVT